MLLLCPRTKSVCTTCVLQNKAMAAAKIMNNRGKKQSRRGRKKKPQAPSVPTSTNTPSFSTSSFMSPPSHLFHSSSSAVLGSYISGVISGARSSASSWPRGTSFRGRFDRVLKAMRLSSRGWRVGKSVKKLQFLWHEDFHHSKKNPIPKVSDSCHKESFTLAAQESQAFITLAIQLLVFINTLLQCFSIHILLCSPFPQLVINLKLQHSTVSSSLLTPAQYSSIFLNINMK